MNDIVQTYRALHDDALQYLRQITWPDREKSLTKYSLHAEHTILLDRAYLCKVSIFF